jgi:DNA-binding winged helix-turn-helix (wHTH) protein/tetratricopeptide (TPR) repeat protein
MTDHAGRAQYTFGPFRVDGTNHELLRDGRGIPLKPKAFDTLMLLLDNRGRVVSKEEMFRALWPGTSIEESSLTQNIYELRKALGDAGPGHAYIQTVPRRGYRFVAPVSGSATNGITLAVLPLRALHGDISTHHLGLGISDALITALTALPGIVVRPISSTSRYAGTDADPLAAAAELKADLIVDGSVQSMAGRVRATARLLDAKSGAARWAETVDQPLEQIFALQDAIAASLARALERATPGATHRAISPAAYQLYLKGRYNAVKATPESLRNALVFYRAAIDAEPRYALAWAGIAHAYTSLDWYGVLSTRESNPQAREAAEHAVAFAPRLAEAHAALALALQYSWDWTGAEREYERALALDPNSADARQWYGVFLGFLGRFDEALAHLDRAQELDPVSLSIGAQIALVLLFARRFEAAAEQLNAVLRVDADAVEARFYLAILRDLQGRVAEAITIHESLPAENPDFRAMHAHALAAAGREAEARGVLGELIASSGRYLPLFWVAVAWTKLGDRDRALAALEAACDDPDDSLLGVAGFPLLDPLRGDPRFDAILRRMQLPALVPERP